jgi:hypothetical protein
MPSSTLRVVGAGARTLERPRRHSRAEHGKERNLSKAVTYEERKLISDAETLTWAERRAKTLDLREKGVRNHLRINGS